MNPIQVSVIVPVYNMQDYLTRCVDSILSQTYDNFELILVDDGSTDSSPEMCDRYQQADSRIKVIHKPNGGLSSARNAGLDVAVGKYIYFADSDDYIDSVLLEKTIAIMETQQCDLVSFGMIKEDIHGEHMERIGFIPMQHVITTEEERMAFLLKYLLNYRMGWEAWNRVFRGDIIRNNNLRFVSERVVFAEDMLFSFTYWLYAKSCVVLPEYFYHYIQREDSIMGKKKSRNVLPQIHMLALEAYEAATRADLPLIQADFAMISLHLLEWQIRPYVAEKGITWVKEELRKLSHGQFWPEEHSKLRHAYQNVISRYGNIDGVVTVVIPVQTPESLPQVERYIASLLNQTLQKLDVLVLSSGEVVLHNEDIRIRQVCMTCFDTDSIIRAAFENGFGEYLYFADCNTELSNGFLEKIGDVLKYNGCSTALVTDGSSMFVDRDSVYGRREFRQYVRDNGILSHKAMVRKDLLEESGLVCMDNLHMYTLDILLSGHIIIFQN